MTDEDQKQDILKWIQEFVETPNPLLNNWPPCPYAKEARLRNQVRLVICPIDAIDEVLQNEAHNLKNASHEVTIVALAKGHLIDLDKSKSLVSIFRKEWVPQDIFLLMDHPKNLETTCGLKMNQGTYQIFFLQRFSALKRAELELKKAGYYSSWSKTYYNQVVQNRKVFSDVF